MTLSRPCIGCGEPIDSGSRSTCGTPGTRTNPPTLDHTPAAWALVESGKRLSSVHFDSGLLSVECLRCNVAKGKARETLIKRQDSSSSATEARRFVPDSR